MEVEAVEMELLRDEDFFVGELGRGEEAVERPVAPRNGCVNANAAAVEAEHRIGADAFRREPAKAEVDRAHIRDNCAGTADLGALLHSAFMR